tara:strand:- start:605 stop:751 length:147 start_codon:yes stop_codon:yes gene_type:complete
MENKKIIEDLEKVIERIRQRIRYNDWASSSFLCERANEINKVINQINK